MPKLRDALSLVKIGIVASNTLTAAAGFVLACQEAVLRSDRQLLLRGLAALPGLALLVAGSCAINNWMDRDLDALMDRTKDRPTARGAIGGPIALGFGAGLSLAGLGMIAAVSIPAAVAGLAGALVYLLAYSAWAKRRGTWSLAIGGVAGAVPPLVGWAAADPRLGAAAWALFGLLLVWQQAHVRALALRREAEYRAAGVPMAGLGRPRARLAVIAWAAATIPFPALALAARGTLGGPALKGPLPAAACAALSLGWALWGLWGLRGRDDPRWADRMFAASLVYLCLVFGILIAFGL
jgi:protoheme IX farnesyltransferase